MFLPLSSFWALKASVVGLVLFLPHLTTGDARTNFNVSLTSTVIGNMQMPRSDFAATPLSSPVSSVTSLIALTGGCNGSNTYNSYAGFYTCDSVTSTTEVWDVTIQKSVPAYDLSLAQPRYRHVAVNLPSSDPNKLGKICVFGGRTLNDDLIKEVECLDLDGDLDGGSGWEVIGNWANATSDLGAFHTSLPPYSALSSTDDVAFVVGGYPADYNPTATVTYFTPDLSLDSQGNLIEYYASSMLIPKGDFGVTNIADPADFKDSPLSSNNNRYFFAIGGFGLDTCNALRTTE